jgi:hypothetical protein
LRRSRTRDRGDRLLSPHPPESTGDPRRTRWLAGLLGAVAAAAGTLLVACASAPPSPAGGGPLWGVTAEDLGTQRLYRVRYEGERGRGSGRLTFYLESARRYELAAADAFGSPVWSLRADGDEGLLVDFRARRACRLAGSVDLADLPLAPLALAAVPPLLLARLPAPPAAGRLAPAAAGEFRDARGRRWTFTSSGGRLTAWTLWEGEEPLLWARLGSGEAVLSARRGGGQLRWREVAREPLRRPPAGTAPPPEYPLAECG